MKWRNKEEAMKKIKLGLDIHGVIDAHPEVFAAISQAICSAGHEVHIITGPYDTPELRQTLENNGIVFTHLFSLASYHEEIGTPIRHDAKGRPWLDDELWERTKGDYCIREKIDMHFDDSTTYSDHFTTPYGLILPLNQQKENNEVTS